MKKTVNVFHCDGTIFQEELPLPPGAAMRLSYFNTHLPSGHVYHESELFVNRHAFDQCLKHWNRLGGVTWKYTEEPPCLMPLAGSGSITS